MNMNKITISIPRYLHEDLKSLVKKREVSKFVAKAVEKQLLEEKVGKTTDEFISLRKKLPKFSRNKILTAIKKGRQ